MRSSTGRRLLAGAIALLALGLGFAVLGPRSDLRYDPARDYVYRFDPDIGVRVAVELTAEGLALTEPIAPGASALLAVEVDSRHGGGLGTPHVDIRVGDGPPRRQYLESGARGLRYLNLGALDGNPPPRVVLEGHGVAWQPQATELLVFRNPPLDALRVLVLAPHPDDAEIAAFGLYSQTDATVVTVTAGEAGDTGGLESHYDDAVQLYRAKGRLRVLDSLTVPRLGGVPPERALNLGYFDDTLREMHDEPQRPVTSRFAELSDPAFFRRHNDSPILPERDVASTWRDLVADLAEILRRVDPNVIVAPHPLLDTHSDHRFTTVAAVAAAERVGWKAGEFYLYANHVLFAESHPEGPPDGVVSLPPFFTDRMEFQGFRSVPLTPERRIDKLFALEANHDLRRPPPPVNRDWRDTRTSLVNGLQDLRRGRGHGRLDYFRRAPRPNEIFFVYSPAGTQALVTQLLEIDTAGG